MRRTALAALGAVLVVGCTGSAPGSMPPESSPVREQLSTQPSPSGNPQEPAPTSIPRRDVVAGGTMTITLAGESVAFDDVRCDLAEGLEAVATAGELIGLAFSVDDAGAVTDMVATLPDGTTSMVGDVVGSATFIGDADAFRVSGDAVTVGDGSATTMSPFVIIGSCADPGH